MRFFAYSTLYLCIVGILLRINHVGHQNSKQEAADWWMGVGQPSSAELDRHLHPHPRNTRKWRDVRADMSPESRARLDAAAAERDITEGWW